MSYVYLELVKPIECARINAINYQYEFMFGEVDPADITKLDDGQLRTLKVARPMLSVIAFLGKEMVIPNTDPNYDKLPDVIPQTVQLPPLAYLQATTKNTRFDEEKKRFVSDYSKIYDFSVSIPVTNIAVYKVIDDQTASIISMYKSFVDEHYSEIITNTSAVNMQNIQTVNQPASGNGPIKI